ncbi:MAG: hypothetical protein HXY18_01195 [Bryobacteraceae bacterium]|nr:hypothetical protein [Bryobacteraceae bacterium]
MPQPRTKARTAAFTAIAAVTLLGLAELAGRAALAVRGVDFAPRWALQHAVLALKESLSGGADGIRFEKPLAMEDPVTGYRCIPGVHRLAMVSGGRRREFTVTIGEDGYRITGRRTGGGRPLLVLHGCSFTWGYLLNDEETFAWKLQERLPEYEVRNLAQNGFGTAHAYLQARATQPPPAAAIVVYAAFHKPRNSPSADWMKQMVAAGEAFRSRRISYPWVRLEHGAPVVELRPMSFGATREGNASNPALEEQSTLALMRAIRAHYTSTGTRFGVAAFTGIAGDRVMEQLAADGVPVLDLSLGSPDYLPDQYKMPPWDRFHPGPEAALIYADRLSRFIREKM